MTERLLTREAADALSEWNEKHYGRGVSATAPLKVTDSAAIERIELLALPDETFSETIIRLIRQEGGILPQ